MGLAEVIELRKARVYAGLKYCILIVFAFVVLYPFIWLISGSFKTMQDLFTNSASLIPAKIVLGNYPQAWKIGELGLHYINSIIVTFSALAIILFTTYLASYALSRMRLPGGKWILIILISCMMVPMQVVVIPLYKFEAFLCVNNTYLGLILIYAAGSLPFAIYVMAAFLRTIPNAIEEAGMMDGCNRLQVIWYILLPLSRPGLATVLIFSFLSLWNEFFLAMIIMQNQKLGTLNLGLLNFQRSFGTNTTYTLLLAALVIISLPVIVVYTIFQKQFISGLTAGSVKA
jgi:ABC-type glycerol-3-phosphate transport system permease component